MKAIVLAAGMGVRMRPLTLDKPKPLLPIAGGTFLDHIFLSLPDEITEAIIVVNYLGDQIRQYCGASFYGRPVTYAEGSAVGTAYSFLAARPCIGEERFLLMYGDELPRTSDLEACLRHPLSILCWEVNDPWNHGVAIVARDGLILNILEKPQNLSHGLIAGGVMVLNHRVFDYQPLAGANNEYYFSSMLDQFVQQEHVMSVITHDVIGGISTPEDLAHADARLRERLKKQ